MKRRLAFVPVLALLGALAFGSVACTATPAEEGAPTPPPASSTVFFSTGEGALVRWVSGVSEASAVLDDVLPAGTPREVAYDSTTGLLWYAWDHSHVASIDPVTLQPGPSIGGFTDVALLGCGVSNVRTLAIDAANRMLLVPQLTGGVLEYRLQDLKLVNIIPASVFGEESLGAFRRIAVAPDGHLWFLSADGSVVEVDRASGPTGRVLVPDQRVVAIAGDGTATPVTLTVDGAIVLDEVMPAR